VQQASKPQSFQAQVGQPVLPSKEPVNPEAQWEHDVLLALAQMAQESLQLGAFAAVFCNLADTDASLLPSAAKAANEGSRHAAWAFEQALFSAEEGGLGAGQPWQKEFVQSAKASAAKAEQCAKQSSLAVERRCPDAVELLAKPAPIPVKGVFT
ncbi:unnamed protein product, partial [Prorocentrum cordatum]